MNRLRELRDLNDLTQDVVASHIGITRAAYSNLERGKRQCDAETLIKLSKLYNVTVGYLLGVETKKEPAAQGSELDPRVLTLISRLNSENTDKMLGYGEFLLTSQEK